MNLRTQVMKNLNYRPNYVKIGRTEKQSLIERKSSLPNSRFSSSIKYLVYSYTGMNFLYNVHFSIIGTKDNKNLKKHSTYTKSLTLSNKITIAWQHIMILILPTFDALINKYEKQ